MNWSEFVDFIGAWLASVESAAPLIAAAAPMSPKAKRKATDDEVEVMRPSEFF